MSQSQSDAPVLRRRAAKRSSKGKSARNAPPSLFGDDAPRHLRVAWYRRASTDEGNQPYSLDAQEERLRSYTAAHPGWEFVGDYVERASAKDIDGRPELQRLLTDAANDAFDLVLVARLDRWSRNLIDCLDTVDYLTEHGVAFHSASEHFDTSTPMGMMTLQMLGMFAEFERNTIIERIHNGNRAKLAKGIPLTGRLGYGLQLDKQGRIAADKNTMVVVQRIFNEYVNGKRGAKTIVAGLNEDGIPGPGVKPWSPDAVLRILRNRAFIGEVRHGEKWLPGAHEPLMDIDLFNSAQERRSSRAKPAAAAAGNSDFILTGTLSCARCGGSYVGTRGTGRGGKAHRYYSCVTARRYGAKQCDGPSLPADELESLVIDALLAAYADHSLFSEAVELYLAKREEDHAPALEQLHAQQTAIKAKERVLAKYQDDYENGSLSAARYETRAAELEDELTAMRVHEANLQLSIDQEPPTVPDEAELASLHALLQQRMRDGNNDARRGVCNALIESLVVHDRDDIAPTFRLLNPSAEVDALVTEPDEVALVGAGFAHSEPKWSLGDSNP